MPTTQPLIKPCGRPRIGTCGDESLAGDERAVAWYAGDQVILHEDQLASPD
jgi:hypothetical protein